MTARTAARHPAMLLMEMMSKRRIDFAKLGWRKKNGGAPEKRYARNGRTLRLVRFTDQFTEEDWCVNGHVGMVLSGRLTIDFGRERIEYKAGNALFIDAGAKDRHKTIIAPGEEATLLLFEGS
jgi:mannose-6-phosphate isomerase-like protein (cupin superfamily)